MSGAVLVVGAVNVDLVVRVPELPGPGETVVGNDLERHGGGKGANAAVAAARQGADVALLGAVGRDDLGAGAVAALEAEGVDCAGLQRVAGRPTGSASIVVDAAGENQIAVAAGANLALDAGVMEAALAERLAGAGVLLVSTEIPDAAVLAAVAAARRAGVPCVLDPAPPRAAHVPALDDGPILTPNRGELRVLARAAGLDGSDDPADDAAALSGRTGAPVVVTLGADGVLLADGEGPPRLVPAAHAPDVRDSTGAGDAFAGVLVAALASGDDLGAAVRRAVAGAALAVAGVGARSSPGRVALDAALASG